MAFWDAQRNAALPPPILIAAWALHGYAALAAVYVAWLSVAVGFSPDEAILTGVRLACAEALAWNLLKRRPWALWLGLAGGLFGCLGLVGVALALAHSGLAGLPLGVVTAAYSIASAVCLALMGILLARGDARAAFDAARADVAPPA